MQDTELLLSLYRKMWLIRAFEETARDLYMRNMMRGATHMYIGEEAIAVGVCANLTDQDYISSTHRGHGHVLAKGADPKRMMAELLGRSTGYCQGKGGSMHIADLEIGILGANGIVGGGIGIAAGAALACKYRGDSRVSVVFFGDGAVNQGVFYETANMAALWKLPLVYVCEQNRFAEFSYSNEFFADQDLSKRAIPFNFPGVNIDGNDVLCVYETAKEAVERARAGEGPSLIVAQTYRIEGHTIGDPLSYRVKGEVDQWKSESKDPLLRFGKNLLDQGILTNPQIEMIEDEAREIIKDAIQFAMESPQPETSTLWRNVYVEE